MELSSGIIRNVIFPLWKIKDGKKNVRGYLAELRKSQYMPEKDLQQFRWKRLKSMLDYAYKHIPFYRARFQQSGITPDDISTHSDLQKLPLLTKEDIQDHLDEIISDEYTKAGLFRDQTGGSTGSPLVFYNTHDRRELREAATFRHDSWAHKNIGDKTALLWGAVQDLTPYQGIKAGLRNALLERKLILDASALTNDDMFRFVNELQRYRPKVIRAYANTMRLFAEFIEKHGLSVPSPRSVICSSEVLLHETRIFIERVLGTEVFNRYGCREFSVIASECEKHKGMHINAEHLYLEFVKGGAHAAEGEMGEIIVTDMMNYGMPLIRYNIKDVGRPLDGLCQCGRSLPLMELGQGRVTDFLVTPAGKYVSGIAVCTFVITNIPGIRQIQIIQDSREHILVKLARNDKFTDEALAALNRNFDRFLDADVKRDFEYVESIPSEQSGKYRFCISNVKPI